MFRHLFILLTCFMLSGCTVITLTYFRNFSNEPVDIWFLPNESRGSYSGSFHPPTHFFYSKEIEPINGRMWKKMKDSMSILYKDKIAIITIPPNTTAQMPRGSFDGKIYIKQAARTDTIWLDKIDRSTGLRYKSGGFPIRSILYYDHQ
jgi:hypothetical protein